MDTQVMNIIEQTANLENAIIPDETVGNVYVDRPRMTARNVNVFYGDKKAIDNVTLDIAEKQVISFIGPSGCGKSTFLRCLNRMNDTIDICRIEGEIAMDGKNIYAPDVDVPPRARVGMVFQKPNPFPKSILTMSPTARAFMASPPARELNDIVESSLERAGLWNQVKDRLMQPGTGLSGGQQQRLCIARAIAVSPEVILMDEPCSALDPIATAKIEELIADSAANSPSSLSPTRCSRRPASRSAPPISIWASLSRLAIPKRCSPSRSMK